MAAESGAPWGWDDAHRALSIAVGGATGAVGRELLLLLSEAGHPRERIACTARRSHALDLGRAGYFEVLGGSAPPRADLAFLCTPSDVSRAFPVLRRHWIAASVRRQVGPVTRART